MSLLRVSRPFGMILGLLVGAGCGVTHESSTFPASRYPTAAESGEQTDAHHSEVDEGNHEDSRGESPATDGTSGEESGAESGTTQTEDGQGSADGASGPSGGPEPGTGDDVSDPLPNEGTDGGEPEDFADCTRVGFEALQEIAESDGQNYSYRASKGTAQLGDFLEIASFVDWNGPSGPGSYSLDGINYRDCGLCLRIWAGCDEEACETLFYADEGIVRIDSIGPDGTPFIASLQGVVFKETTFEDDYTSVEVAGGERWCLDGYSINQVVGAGPTENDLAEETLPESGDGAPSGSAPVGDEAGGADAEDTGAWTDDDCSLSVLAEVRDESGPCVSCTAGDYITVVGVIENNCAQTLTYQSEKSCLVSEFEVYNLYHGSAAQYPMTCDSEVRTETLAPGERVTQTRPAGRLSNGDYELTVQFEDGDRSVRTLTFGVE